MPSKAVVWGMYKHSWDSELGKSERANVSFENSLNGLNESGSTPLVPSQRAAIADTPVYCYQSKVVHNAMHGVNAQIIRCFIVDV